MGISEFIARKMMKREANPEEGLFPLEYLSNLTEELNQKDEELQNEIENWSSTFNSISDPIMIVAPDHTIVRTNKAFDEIYGDCIGEKCYTIVHQWFNVDPVTDCPMNKIMKRTSDLKSGSRTDMHEFCVNSDHYIEVSCTVIYEDWEVKEIIHIIRDITERRKAEKKIRFLSLITEQVTDAIIVTDLNDKITYINKAAELLYGYTSEELEGKHPGILNAESNAEQIAKDVDDDVSHGKVYHARYENVRKNGSKFFVESRIQSLNNHEGHEFGRIGISRDISDQIQAAKEITESAERFRQLADMTGEGLLFHVNGIIIDANKALLDMFKEKKEDIIGETMFRFIQDDVSKRKVVNALKEPAEDIIEITVYRKDGTYFPVETQGREIMYEGKKVRVVSVKDISRRYEIINQIRDF